jgi:NitT/TauT family transport system substrate-binding protein
MEGIVMKETGSKLSRRRLLISALAATTAPLASAWAEDVPPLSGPKKVTLAWMPTALCHIAVPVADKQGFFKKNNLDVEFVNWAGSTDMLLEAISTGHADAGLGMALRWLKPMEQGFDVKLTAGTHGGCMKVLTAPDSEVKSITDLRHKRLGVGDIAGVDKNFFSIVLQKKGIDPVNEVEWKQFPADLLGQALKKGEIDALSTSDPLAFILKRDNGLIEIANNLENGYENLTCCVLGIRGSLIRSDRPTAAAITRSLIDAADWADKHPIEAAEIYAPFAPKQRAADLAEMLKSVTSDLHPTSQDLQHQIASYVDDLKLVGVMKPSVDPVKFVSRVCVDVFA